MIFADMACPRNIEIILIMKLRTLLKTYTIWLHTYIYINLYLSVTLSER